MSYDAERLSSQRDLNPRLEIASMCVRVSRPDQLDYGNMLTVFTVNCDATGTT